MSQYFYPEQFRVNDICEEWVKKGYEVTVLTGIPNYPVGKFYKGFGFFKKRNEVHKGINIIRIPIIPRGKNSLMLALNYFSFVVSGFIWGLFTRLKPDRVFIYEVSPMTQALPGVWLSKRRKIPCDIYVLDLWPENFSIITGINNNLVIKSLLRMVNYIYKSSKNIFISSPSFRDSICEKGDYADKIKYWPQFAEDFYEKKTGILENIEELRIVFAGNIGYAQGLDILPETAIFLKERMLKVKFVIVGDGRYKKELMTTVQKNKVEDYFEFKDKVEANKIPEIFSENHLSLISLSKNEIFKMTLPAKLQSTMACGMPILVAADGEVSKVVEESKSGLVGPSGDATALARNIELIFKNRSSLKVYSENSFKYYINNFSKNHLMDEMDKYMDFK